MVNAMYTRTWTLRFIVSPLESSGILLKRLIFTPRRVTTELVHDRKNSSTLRLVVGRMTLDDGRSCSTERNSWNRGEKKKGSVKLDGKHGRSSIGTTVRLYTRMTPNISHRNVIYGTFLTPRR